MQVEGDAALDEEDRDEEPEADRLELALYRLAVLTLDEEAHHDAGSECAEQHVEAQLEGQVDQQDHEEERDPHRQL